MFSNALIIPFIYYYFDRSNLSDPYFGDNSLTPVWFLVFFVFCTSSGQVLWTASGYSVVFVYILICE